jgi:hypothetical protein
MSRPEGVRSFRREVRLTRWRIKAMGELLDRWDEYEAMLAQPPGTQGKPIKRPELSREVVEDLHKELLERLEQLEAAWERRN